MVKKVSVLRYGHRDFRDYRVTSHCCLVARAFGADEIIIEGEAKEIKKSVDEVTARWGGGFKVKFADSWKTAVKEFSKKGYKSVHLTMYGLPLSEVVSEIRSVDNVLVIIGSQKVEREVYEVSDFNVAIGNNPHSEIAALSVFLHDLFEGKELDKEFKGGKVRVIPQAHGKKVTGN